MMPDSGSPFGPSLSPDATYAERQIYCRDVLMLPGPVDRWLIANSRSPNISFLQDYLLLTDIKKEYVVCFVEYVCISVCHPFLFQLSCMFNVGLE
jgi:hypothetical protein